MQNFYVLEYTSLGPTVTTAQYKHIECGVCGTRPVARVGSTSVRFTRQDDLVDITRTADGTIVRQSVLKHLTERGITGWRSGALTVEAAPRLHDQDLSYSELVIIGHTRGYAEHVRLLTDSECSECGRRAYVFPQEGVRMPIDCWDGSDIFVIDELPGLTIVTESVRQVIEQYGHTGIECMPIADWRDPLGWLQEKRLAQVSTSIWPPIHSSGPRSEEIG
jgi:hypothetical protein